MCASLKETLSVVQSVGSSVCNAFIKFAEIRRKKLESTRRKGDEEEVTRKNEQQGGRSNEEEGAARRMEQRGGWSNEEEEAARRNEQGGVLSIHISKKNKAHLANDASP